MAEIERMMGRSKVAGGLLNGTRERDSVGDRSSTIVIVVVGLLLLGITLVTPFYPDTCVWQAITLDFVHYGRILYIDSLGSNFPGIMLMHWLAIVLFGGSDMGVRVFDTIAQIVCALVLYRLLRRWMAERAATIAVILYLAYYVSSGSGMYFQRDVYVMMALVVCMYLLLNKRFERRSRYLQLVVCGLIAGYTVLTRPTSLLFVVMIGAFILASKWKRGFHYQGNPQFGVAQASMRAIVFLISAMLPCGLFIAYYATIPHGLQALYDNTIRFNLDIYANYHLPYFLFWWEIGVKAFFFPFFFIGVFAIRSKSGSPLKGAGVRETRVPFKRGMPRTIGPRGGHPPALARALTPQEAWLYWGLLAASMFIVLFQHKFFRYHFAPTFMLLCPIAAMGIDYVAHLFRPRLARGVCIVVSIYLCTFLTYKQPFVPAFLMAVLHGHNGLNAAYDVHYNDAQWGGVRERQVLAYLSNESRTTDRIEVCSLDPALRSHLWRMPAGPHALPAAIAFGKDFGRAPHPIFTDYQLRWRAEYIDTLRTVKPLFIVLGRNTMFLFLRDPYISYLHDLPGFDSLLQSAYRYDTTFGAYQLFRKI